VRLIIDGEYNKDLVKLIGKQNLPISHVIVHVPQKVIWGMGEYTEDGISKVTHKTDFNTIKKVNSGVSNPIEATMEGTYLVEGDMTKLMACTPLAPLNGKVHGLISKTKEKISKKW
jgi:hypothetical protein